MVDLDLEIRQDTMFVRLVGELDLGVADALRDAMELALNKNIVRHMVINLSRVAYIDSSGLGVILCCYKRLAQSGGRVSLVGLQPQVRRILDLSGLLRIMGEYSSEEEAVAKAG